MLNWALGDGPPFPRRAFWGQALPCAVAMLRACGEAEELERVGGAVWRPTWQPAGEEAQLVQALRHETRKLRDRVNARLDKLHATRGMEAALRGAPGAGSSMVQLRRWWHILLLAEVVGGGGVVVDSPVVTMATVAQTAAAAPAANSAAGGPADNAYVRCPGAAAAGSRTRSTTRSTNAHNTTCRTGMVRYFCWATLAGSNSKIWFPF